MSLFARAASRATSVASRKMSIGNNAARPFETPKIPAINAEALSRKGLKFSVWGAPAGLVVGWLFWGRRHEIIHEVNSILGVEAEE